MSIKAGGTVTWVNNGNELHSVISREGLWSDPKLSRGESFNYTFTRSGTYTYNDDPDTHIGTVIVR